MGIPKYHEIMRPLLECSSDEKPRSVQEISQYLVEQFQLTDEEKIRQKPSGGQTLFRNRCGWAEFYLRRAGLLERIQNGHTKITKEGIEFLQSHPSQIDKKALMKIPRFAKYMQKVSEKNDRDAKDESDDRSPEDKVADGIAEIRKNLEQDVLERVQKSDPYYFEQIVVNLLENMGYGHGQVTERSGDGGIDGIITEDKLGFDEIYLQAKRWQHNVGAKDLRDFAGSLLTKKSHKGVFITTSDFSSEAQNYVKTATNTKIILIDGKKLANLMYEYNVGFETGNMLELKKIDEEYFSS